jgi:hypothetical protein
MVILAAMYGCNLNANLTSALCFFFSFSETHNNVTVFFSDIVRFTDISQSLSAVKVCTMLDRLYVAFDALANKHEVFKVETIGDAWVGVTNCTCFLTKRDSPLSVCMHFLTITRTLSLFSSGKQSE